MPTWFTQIILYIRPLILATAGFFGSQWVVRMTGAEIPTWTLLLIAASLGFTAIFLERIAERLWSLYQIKKLKYLVGGVFLLVLIVWAGWPWQRIQNTFAEITLKQKVISEIWMSEQDAEQFIIDKLQNKGDREVFDWRVRNLLRWQFRKYKIGRFRCAGDSTWRSLHHGELRAVTSLDLYDGTERLSEFIDCEVEYSTEYIYKLNWLEIDKKHGVKPPNPESSRSR